MTKEYRWIIKKSFAFRLNKRERERPLENMHCLSFDLYDHKHSLVYLVDSLIKGINTKVSITNS